MKPPSRQALVLGLAIAVVFPFVFCRCGAVPSYSTWESEGEIPEFYPISPREAVLIPGMHPLGATVSHHLFAYSYIEDTFLALKAARPVDVFIIMSPLHFNQGYKRVSLTDRSWKTGSGFVQADRGLVGRLRKKLGVDLDPMAFFGEHGVSTLVPFIARHFPRARVIPIACKGELPLDEGLGQQLSDAILPLFEGAGAERYFLLVSADFSHHGGEAATASRDSLSRRFFERPGLETSLIAGSDNALGIYVLASLADSLDCAASVLHHTTSYRIDPQAVDPGDITSYFFSFIYKPAISRARDSRL